MIDAPVIDVGFKGRGIVIPSKQYDAILAKLSNVKPIRGGHTARCPAHEDTHNSLSLTLKDSKILLKCHANCETKGILDALGMEWSDLFAENVEKEPSSRIVATYDYTDENGNILFQSVRYEPKRFAQRHPNARGDWGWNLNGTRRVLYHLPELIAANPSEPIFICEGEKDVDALRKLGLLATTNPLGAGKWRDEYSETLRDRHLVIIPDNDDAGRTHAQAVLRSVRPFAASVKILELDNLPTKGDVSDWLAAGGTAETLSNLATNAPFYGNDVIDRPADSVVAKSENSNSAPTTISLSAYMPSLIDGCLPLPASACLPTEVDTHHQWLDAYINFSRRWSPRSFDGFHEAVGLWVLSTVAARRVTAHLGKDRFTNLSIALVSRTSIFAKSTNTEIGKDTLDAAGLRFLLAPDRSTPQSLVKGMVARLPEGFGELSTERQEFQKLKLAFAAQRGWYYEEFGEHLQSMMSARDNPMSAFRGLLRQFDDCPSDYEVSTISRSAEYVERPYLAILGNMTPADMQPFARRGAALWNDGFFARFAFIAPPNAKNPNRARFPKGKRIVPIEIINPLQEWHTRLGLPQIEIDDEIDVNGKKTGKQMLTILPTAPIVYDVADQVQDAFYNYHDALTDLLTASGNQDLDGNYARFAEKAFRIALLLASVEDAAQVEMRHWARAQEITERWRTSLHCLIDQLNTSAPSKRASDEERIAKLVTKLKKATPAEVQRYFPDLGSSEIAALMQGMTLAGNLTQVDTTRKGTPVYSIA